jgi:cobalt-precorrin-7 (C5)-methyltransferase
VKIIGVGCGPGMLTEQAIAALRSATLVYGSGRAVELARPCLPDSCRVHIIEDYGSLRALPEEAVVLSTGDPMLAGLGYLKGEVIPGISSLQIAAARLHLPLTRIAVISAHGKDHASAITEAVAEVGWGKIAFILADPDFSLEDLARETERAGLSPAIAVCEELGYPAERIAVGDTRHLPEIRSPRLYSLVLGTFSAPR